MSNTTLKTEKTVKPILLTCAFAIVIALLARFQLIDLFEYRIWGDRALARAFFWTTSMPTMGAELNFAGRVPGSALYALLGLLQQLSHSPLLPYVLQVLMDIIAIFLVFRVTHRYCNVTTAAIATTMYSLSIPILQHLNELWNPGFIMLPSVLMLLCSFRIIIDRKFEYFIPLFLIGGIAAQFHLSVYPFLIANLTAILLWTISSFCLKYLSFIAAGVIILFLCQWNYWLFEVTNHFPNTSLIFSNPTDFSRGGDAILSNIIKLVRKLSFVINPFIGKIDSVVDILKFIGYVVLDILILISFLSAISLLVSQIRLKKFGLYSLEPKWKMLITVSLVSGLTITYISIASLNAHFRYVLGAVAPTCIFIGIGLGTLIKRLQALECTRKRVISRFLISAFFFFGIATQAIDYLQHLPKRGLHTYSTLRDILNTVRSEFGLAGDAFRERVAFTNRIQNGRIISFNSQTTFTYATEVLFPPLSSSLPSFCLLVTTPNGFLAILDETGKPKLIVEGLNEAISIKAVLKRNNYTIIKYQTASNNCLKNTENPYVHLKQAATIRDNWERAGAQKLLNKKAMNFDNLFVFRGSAQGMFGASISLNQKSGMIRATLRSSNLRDDGSRVCPPGKWRPTGKASFDIWSFIARNPAIIMIDKATAKVTTISLYDGILGEPTSGRLTPWFASTQRPDGNLFDVYFTADLLFKCAKAFERIKILLSDNYALDPT